MTPAWPHAPGFRIVVDPTGTPTTYTEDHAVNLTVVRPENNISSAILRLHDHQNANYTTVFTPFSLVDVYLSSDRNTYTKVLRGHVHTLAPLVGDDGGELLDVALWGNGWGLMKTHADTSWGTESQHPTISHPQDILIDICDNYVEKQFDDAATGWTLNTAKIEAVHDATNVTHLDGRYLDTFTLVNRVCDLACAYAWSQSTVGPHWMVDTSDNLYVKLINVDSSDAVWTRYWGGSQALSTITATSDMLRYGFKRHMHEYANHVVFCSAFRKPAWDYWTEDAATNALWGEAGGGDGITDNEADQVVGNDCLQHLTDGAVTDLYYPAAQNAAWNLNTFSSPNTCGSINFYLRWHGTVVDIDLHMVTDVAQLYYKIIKDSGGSGIDYVPTADKWYHLSIPVGQYANRHTFEPDADWVQSGALATWSDIDYLQFEWDGADDDYLLIDDLHFAGKIIREAKDTSEITTYNDHQKVIINDTAVDDTMKSGTPEPAGTTDTGTAGRLARAELHRRVQLPLTGLLTIPLAVTFLPGQTTHIHACPTASGTYAIDQDFRAIEVTHTIDMSGATTLLNLTSDVTNSHAIGAPTHHSLLAEYVGALGHREAKNLKGAGIDPLITRLTETY